MLLEQCRQDKDAARALLAATRRLGDDGDPVLHHPAQDFQAMRDRWDRYTGPEWDADVAPFWSEDHSCWHWHWR